MNMKKIIRTAGNILSTLMLLLSVGLCILVIATNISCNKSGEEPFYFGHRPCLIQTGSMEPYMMTNGMILTKEVTSIDEIAVGDVVTYKLVNDTGKTIRITHRVQSISEDGIIRTKGDNNNVEDSYSLTMDNVYAKVVGVYNGSAWFINQWQSSATGKVVILSIVLSIVFLFYAISTLISGWLNDEDIDEHDLREYRKTCRKHGLVPKECFQKDLSNLKASLAITAAEGSEKNEQINISNG